MFLQVALELELSTAFDSAGLSLSIYLTATQDVTKAGSRLGLRVPRGTVAQGRL